jgi:hypothetical protein
MNIGKIEVHPIRDAEWSLVKSWFAARNYPAPQKKFLPRTSAIVSVAGDPICAGYLFKTDAKIGIINHVIATDRIMDKQVRSDALDYLIFHLCERARAAGILLVTAASNVARMNERYERMKFTKTDSNEVHYGRYL